MIKKPLSVRVAGWFALGLFALLVGWAGTAVTHNPPMPPDPDIAFVVLPMLGCVAWWVVGTVLHRSRVNRMKYQGRSDKW